MLILTRRMDESIIIDDQIVVTVLGIEGDKVKLGVTAPREMKIYRNELWQAIREQEHLAEQLAAGADPDTFESLRQLLAAEASEEAAGEQGAETASAPSSAAVETPAEPAPEKTAEPDPA
jgi:carbon storage regulator